MHGGVCDNGVCEFRCSDYAGYTCQNSSMLFPSLSVCGDVLDRDAAGQHCAPSELSILQQLEAAVVMPNYNRLIPGSRSLFSILDNGYCAAAAKRLACWVSYSCSSVQFKSQGGLCRMVLRIVKELGPVSDIGYAYPFLPPKMIVNSLSFGSRLELSKLVFIWFHYLESVGQDHFGSQGPTMIDLWLHSAELLAEHTNWPTINPICNGHFLVI